MRLAGNRIRYRRSWSHRHQSPRRSWSHRHRILRRSCPRSRPDPSHPLEAHRSLRNRRRTQPRQPQERPPDRVESLVRQSSVRGPSNSCAPGPHVVKPEKKTPGAPVLAGGSASSVVSACSVCSGGAWASASGVGAVWSSLDSRFAVWFESAQSAGCSYSRRARRNLSAASFRPLTFQ
jgi:hypothetical protein